MNQKDQYIKELEGACTRYAAEVARLDFKVGELTGEVQRLQHQLEQNRHPKQQLRGLYQSIDRAVIRRIDARGFAPRRPKQPKRSQQSLLSGIDGKPSVSLLLQVANWADAQAFFAYRSAGHGMRLQYRVLGKTYRVLRDVSVGSAKVTYKLIRKIK